jgi:hypothetical protein
MPQPVLTPRQRDAPLDDKGLLTRLWYLYFASVTTAIAELIGDAAALRKSGLSVTIVTASLTVGGTQGSQIFTAGVLTAQVQAT